MTTIAWDGESLAADRRATIGRTYAYEAGKIFVIAKLAPERFEVALVAPVAFAAAGDRNHIIRVKRWLETGEDKPELPDDADFEALIVSGNQVWRMESGLMPWLILSPQTAIGTGRDYALAAMHCGSTAAEAVAIAALFDPGTGGGVDTVTLTLEIDHGR